MCVSSARKKYRTGCLLPRGKTYVPITSLISLYFADSLGRFVVHSQIVKRPIIEGCARQRTLQLKVDQKKFMETRGMFVHSFRNQIGIRNRKLSGTTNVHKNRTGCFSYDTGR